MNFFHINFNKLVFQLLPIRLRQPIMQAWLQCLLAPVKRLHASFIQARQQDQYFTSHTGQTTYLQAILNDIFDPTGRGIYITDGRYEDPIHTYLQDELKPVWLGIAGEAPVLGMPVPLVLYTNAETASLGNSFIIMVPSTLIYDTHRMRALVERYRLASKNNYSIQPY